MSDYSFEAIPRFKRDESNEFPWANCTAGTAETCEKFALLARLGIPLGDTNNDAICRNRILQSLLHFEESIGNKKHKIVANNHKTTGHCIKIPCAPSTTSYSKKKGNKKVEPLSESEKAKRLYKTGAVGLILECISDDGTATLSNDFEATAARKEEAANILCSVLAKHHNQAFLAHMDEAKEIAKRLEKKKPFVAPPDLIMYDGGDRNDRDHCMWNVRYRELLEYKRTHGDCLLPSKPSGEQQGLAELSRWVTYQRSSKKSKTPSLTPKRIELLEEAGFVWTVNPNFYDSVPDPRFHKTIAAKLFFQDITAHDAMIVSGFPQDEASNDSRKKLVNATVCNFYKKSLKIKEPTLKVLQRLRQADQQGALEMVLAQIYGESERLSSLLEHGKLVPRANDNGGGGKPAAAASAKRQRADDDDDDVKDENRVRTNHQQRRLPLTMHKKDDRAWV